MKVLKGLILPAVIVTLWMYFSTAELVNPFLIPPPQRVARTTWVLLKKGILYKHVLVSLIRVFTGFSLTFLIAFPLAVLIGINEGLEPYVKPVMEFIRHIPPIACISILILWFGIGETSKLAVIILATFFPIFLNTLHGILSCDKKLLEVGEIYGFGFKEKFYKIILPWAVPSVIVGMRLGLGYSWRSLIGAELIAASSGLGYMIIDAEQLSRSDIILVGILTIGFLGYLIDYLFFKIQHCLIPWKRDDKSYGRIEN